MNSDQACMIFQARPLAPEALKLAKLAAKGLTHKELADRLGLTVNTVKVRLTKDVYPRLGVNTQAKLVRYWADHIERRGDCGSCLLNQAHQEPVPC